MSQNLYNLAQPTIGGGLNRLAHNNEEKTDNLNNKNRKHNKKVYNI